MRGGRLQLADALAHTLRTNLTSRANSTQLRQKLGKTNPDVVRHWLTDKRAQHATAAYRCKFVAKKRLYKEQELVVSHSLSTIFSKDILDSSVFAWKGPLVLYSQVDTHTRAVPAPPFQHSQRTDVVYGLVSSNPPRRRLYRHATKILASHANRYNRSRLRWYVPTDALPLLTALLSDGHIVRRDPVTQLGMYNHIRMSTSDLHSYLFTKVHIKRTACSTLQSST